MTAREQAIIGGIEAVTDPTSPEGAAAIASLFSGDRFLYIDFLDPDSIESYEDRVSRRIAGAHAMTWVGALLLARDAHPGAFVHLFDDDTVAA